MLSENVLKKNAISGLKNAAIILYELACRAEDENVRKRLIVAIDNVTEAVDLLLEDTRA